MKKPIALMFLLSGCGASSQPHSAGSAPAAAASEGGETGAPPYPEEASQAEEGESDLVADAEPLMEGLSSSMQTQETGLREALRLANCGEANDLRETICEIAERICHVAERHEGEQDFADRCTDGRERCERATRTVRERCG